MIKAVENEERTLQGEKEESGRVRGEKWTTKRKGGEREERREERNCRKGPEKG